MKARSLTWIWVAAVAAAAGCQRKPPPEAKAATLPPVQVESALIDEHPVPKTLIVTGTLEADQRTELAANAAGRVTRTFVERGDHVKAGALLAQLDTRGAALGHAEAEANAKAITEQLESVRAECKRYAALRDKGAITQQEYDRQAVQCRTQASSEEAARARLAEAARVIQDAAIRAPFAGVIGERFISVGDYVQPNSKVVTLLVDDPLRLRLSVPEPAIPYAKEGTEVRFKVLSIPDREFTARIKYVGREVRPTTRDLIDEAVVDNRERLLLPGTFVTAELPTGNVNQALVPKNALVDAGGEHTVFAIVDQRLEQRAVHTGMSIDDRIAVSEGLKKGDRVVLNPKPDLKDGSPVVLR
ncbi:MAG TPA: efflux RND transporter periplasmic adaptor subunit [Polyangiales bacterium]|nr:efflux RND transporter periplasmic adaptor subunit [Polyangiales bacterium]